MAKSAQNGDANRDAREAATLLAKQTPDNPKQPGHTSRLLTWDEIAEWQQDNYYIVTGYRAASWSYLKSLASLGYLHNESVNIYTHGLGAFFYSGLGYVVYHNLKGRYATASIGDVLATGCFFAGAFLCMGMSSTFHLIMNHSPRVQDFGNALDYLGIVCLIAGSYVPNVYYGFYCDPVLQWSYWGLMGAVGLGCAVVSVRPEFRTPKWRTFRACMFVGMGLSSVGSVIHGCLKYGASQFNRQMRYEWMIYEGIQYTLGAALYAARVPERFAPGKFDIWGSSHQIFHVLVLTAAGTHLAGVIKAFDYCHQYVRCAG
ncbi:hypothetical protein H2200_004524 [Cladophialophora chaetospira]|uniref:HlyIII-domain-containing protein n=1 Tax=Cladophialophora chaetospira TaxID=386627 RepID=A0AA38XDE6_9EURO|nr:hypothetical protein H2200_004524 [Cladophialophora chaetospira]